MARLTREQFNDLEKQELSPSDADEKDKKTLIARIYDWQHSNNLYAWDEEGLKEDESMQDLNVSGFVISGESKSGELVEVQFYQPLDEDIENEGVAFGYRLIMLQDSLYTLQKYRKGHHAKK